jgi:uncharacterized protein (DUF2235 family)
MPKNIVICADGTGNKFRDRNTNVVKLYGVLDLSDPTRQIAYYHAGVGTMGAPGALSQWSKRWTKVKGMAFGFGVTQAIGDIYSFLMDTFEPGDRVFLFGFSRGAYTVRAVAGMLHFLGLIRPKDYNLIDYATEMLKAKQNPGTFDIAADFKQTFSRECKPYFTGVWDTVSSVGWIWDPLHVPYTARNPDLTIGRHALAIDERRCFFRQNMWSAPLPGQDIKQVWFAGVHSDVGGGYPEKESGLAKISLEWMLNEACTAGLLMNNAKVESILGYGGDSKFVKPDESAQMHHSLRDAWILLEPLPHRYWDMAAHPPTWKIKLPLGRRRYIKPLPTVHESVDRRIALGRGYDPPNLPKERALEPWVRWKPCQSGHAG